MFVHPDPFLARWQVALLRLVIRGGGIRRIHVASADGTQFVQIGSPLPGPVTPTAPEPPPLVVQLERAYQAPDATTGR